LVNNKEVQKICSITTPDSWRLEIFPHNEKALLFHANRAVLYDIKKNIEEWHTIEPDTIRSATFNPHEEVLYFYYKNQTTTVMKYNYAIKKRDNIVFDRGCNVMAIHPKEKIMCVAGNIGNIYFHDIDNMDLKKSIMLPIHTCFFCEYNSDGSCIAVGSGNDILIVDPSKDEDDDGCWHYLEHNKQEVLKKIVFHPEVVVVAGLFDAITKVGVKRILYCWDIKTKQIVYTSQLNSESEPAYDFDFSGDGAEFIIVAKDKVAKDRCMRAKVSFEVLYQHTKKEFLYHLFLLQQLSNKQQDVPKEIKQYCARLLLQAYKR